MKNFSNRFPWAFILLAGSIFSVLFGGYVVAVQSVTDITSYCMEEDKFPDNVKPVDVISIGIEYELFPLGLTCSWEVGVDDPVIVAKPNWTVAVLVYGGIVGAGAAAIFVARTGRRKND